MSVLNIFLFKSYAIQQKIEEKNIFFRLKPFYF